MLSDTSATQPHSAATLQYTLQCHHKRARLSNRMHDETLQYTLQCHHKKCQLSSRLHDVPYWLINALIHFNVTNMSRNRDNLWSCQQHNSKHTVMHWQHCTQAEASMMWTSFITCQDSHRGYGSQTRCTDAVRTTEATMTLACSNQSRNTLNVLSNLQSSHS